jgi:hypothetical protein
LKTLNNKSRFKTIKATEKRTLNITIGLVISSANFEKRKLKPKEVQLFHNLGITPEDFLDRSNHRGSASIGLFATIKAYIDMQKYCKRRNLKLFLAINQVKDFEQILYVATSKNPTYKEFKTL